MTSSSQNIANLKKINKAPVLASEDKQEINRYQALLIQRFLAKANDPQDKINKEIQDFFIDYNNQKNSEAYIYPTLLTRSNLTISVTGYDVNWGLLPSAHDTTKLEGNGNTMLRVIISIPIYDNYHRGYSINSISFCCKLTEAITWTEIRGNELPIEKLPTYKRRINFKAKVLDLDN
ncbi:hypothetical protein [Ferruginibacter albus]|uniref:hypothetical protein n=1 Tax=Ferruginibacter albus TaxID=2875540 RepID=UPI001CC76EE6|nr:hypothetical protein [Ferruginibacter albus]UAY50730.1 hypothetical protein K9M53_08995 [Ferruginibacter albus]